MSLPLLQNFINGKFIPAATDATFDVVDPRTEQVVAQCPVSGSADVDAAYAAALQSATSLLLVLVTSLTGSLLVLATNVVTPKTRPWLSRTADTISTLVIIAVPPFALYMWGM